MLVSVVFILVGALFLLAALLHWRKIVGFNRRLFGPPRSEFQKAAEQVNRAWGMAFLAGLGVLLIVTGVVALVGAAFG